MRTKVTITVTVDCADAAQAQQAQQILDRYEFKIEGLQKLDQKLQKNDFMVTAATKDFINKK